MISDFNYYSYYIMGSGKPKGGKKVRRGKNIQTEDLKILTASVDQYYGRVTQLLGNARVYVDVFIPKNEKLDAHVKQGQLGIIRGSMRKRVWVNNGSIVLVSLREFEEGKVDILYSYKPEQVAKLKYKNELPKSTIFENDGNGVQFEKNDSDNSDNEIFAEQKPKSKQSYSSNFSLIPDEELNYSETDDDTIENL